jgi:hypothetical protein
MRGTSLVLALCGLAASARRVEAGESNKPVLIVMDLVAEQGVTDSTVRLLNELLLTEFQRTGRYEVIGGSDLQAMLESAVQAQRVGCVETECLAEIGGALGGDLMTNASLGRVGDYFLLNLKILNVRNAKVVGRWSTQVEAKENRLMNAVRETVASATGGAVSPPPEGPSGPYGHFIAAAAAGVLGIAGASFGVVARNDASRADGEVIGTPAWDENKRAMETHARTADVLFGLAGAAAVTTVVLWVMQ